MVIRYGAIASLSTITNLERLIMAKEKAAPKEDPKAETKAAPKRGVGTVACEAIRGGATNQQALEAVQAEFPAAKTTLASINWYRNDLRTKGEDVPTSRDLNKKANAAKKAEKAAKKAARKTKETDPTA